MMPELECNKRTDLVDRMVKDMTAAEVVIWLIEHHGLKEASRDIVESNLTEQMRWHRLRGRLDRTPWLAAVVELWLRSRGAK